MTESNRQPLRIAYMGTPEFAVPALNALATSADDVVGVVTPPDRPAGRGKKPSPPDVKVAAEEAGLPVFQPDDINSSVALDKLEQWDPDVIVVAAFGQILKSEVLELAEHGCLNIHASLLPRLRGAAPINWAIVRGEKETGVTIMQMDEGLDTGPMLLKKKTLIGELETAGQLHDRLAKMGAELIVDVMRLIHLDSLNPVDQNDEDATWAPMLSKEDGLLDWSDSAVAIARRIRGFNPWPGTYSFYERDDEGNERIKFHLAKPVDPADHDVSEKVPGGTVVRADRNSGELWIATEDGVLDCLELQAPGRKAMDAGDFLNGHSMIEGDRFVETR